jgi:hypothetical protein
MDVRKLLTDNAVLPLWPETGRLLGLSRSSVYKGAEDGSIKTVSFGRLSLRAAGGHPRTGRGVEPPDPADEADRHQGEEVRQRHLGRA